MIGDQCWFKENLNVGNMINGSSNQTNNGVTEKYCYGNSLSNCDIYGGLYQWNELMQYSLSEGSQGICPSGWHIPTETELCELTQFIDATVNCGMTGLSGTNAGGRMKEAGTSHWSSPNTGADNASFYTGLPAGYRNNSGGFDGKNFSFNWWTSSQNGSSNSYYRQLAYNNSKVYKNDDSKTVGKSVRCIKNGDNLPPEAPQITNPPNDTVNQPILLNIAWSCSDPNNDPLTFDVFLGDTNPPALYASGITNNYINDGSLAYNTQYYWRVVAHDDNGNFTSGLIWNFSTCNGLPDVVTDSITYLGPVSATCRGIVTDEGGSPVTSRGVCWSLTENPTINDSVIINGSGLGEFTCEVTGLKTVTHYFVRAYATNSYGTSYGEQLQFATTWSACPGIPTVAYEGRIYNTVQIGDQCWLKENLNVGIMINGSVNQTNNLIIEKYCYNNDTVNCAVYGGLYQWDEMINYDIGEGSKGICPAGWHVPSVDDWESLINQLGGYEIAGGKMKSTGTIEAGTGLWYDPNIGATNESGFTTLPSGNRHSSGGGFFNLGVSTDYWCSKIDWNWAWYYSLYSGGNDIQPNILERRVGRSVRCIKDVNQPPYQPINSSPPDSAQNQSLNTSLVWNCTDPENDSLVFDVYFGLVNPPMLVSSGQSLNTYFQEENLSSSTTYYWQIIVHDTAGNSTVGTVWSFTTQDYGLPILTTEIVTEITPNTAICGGNIFEEGTSPVIIRGLCWSINQNPTIEDSVSMDGGGDGNYVSQMTDLFPSTIFYVRAYATNNIGTSYGNQVDFQTSWQSCPGISSLTYGGQTYNTVKIGSQCWFKENLNIGVHSFAEDNGVIEKFCYDFYPENCSEYGGLYKWIEMMDYEYEEGSQGICPSGWHVPTINEWDILIEYLGGPSVAGRKLIEVGTLHWNFPINTATNESGFTGLPGGYWDQAPEFFAGLHTLGYFWTSTITSGNPWYNNLGSSQQHWWNSMYTSVRCIKNTNQPPEIPNNPLPTDDSYNQPINISLSWDCSDPENDPLSYDVYFGTTNPPQLASVGKTETVFNPDTLELNMNYYWKIIAHDDYLNITESPVWKFTTLTNPEWQCNEPFLDTRDGQTYNTILIGNQCWLAKNLNIGTIIDGSLNQENNGSLEKYCYNNNPENCEIYGGLYQWDEAMEYKINSLNEGICPAYWHIPDSLDLTYLRYFLGFSEEGGKMKEAGNIHWHTPNYGATNLSGFTGLPGGTMNSGSFNSLGYMGVFWCSTENANFNQFALHFMLDTYNAELIDDEISKSEGLSVRCIKNINAPPFLPLNPFPPDDTDNQCLNIMLSWYCSDPENDSLTYDVYFGTINPPELISSGQTDSSYNPGTLLYNTTYYWKIVARDNQSNQTEGPVWSFSTVSGSLPVLTTQLVSGITPTSATSGGNITYEGSSPVISRGICWGLNQNPTINDSSTLDGEGTGSYISQMTGLFPSTNYYIRAYATNDYGTAYGNEVIFQTTWNTCPGIPTIEYYGQVYNTVLIGNQCWLKENLNAGIQASQENNGIIEKYCYDFDTVNCEDYGALYSWLELMNYSEEEGSRGICPSGWHIPTKGEFDTLTNFLGGASLAGGKLKEAGIFHWSSTTPGVTNECGFTGLPGGKFDITTGNFNDLHNLGYFWSSTKTNHPWYRFLNLELNFGTWKDNNDGLYLNVRCLKNENLPPDLPTDPSPPDGSVNQLLNIGLTWNCSDPENDPITYDVYLSTSDPPELVSIQQSQNFFNPDTLYYGFTYYWKIVAHDNQFNITDGPIWTFTTVAEPEWQCGDTILDIRDEQIYNTVQIGSQCWMAENINIGSIISGSQNPGNNGLIEKFCYQDNPDNCDIYGGLYSWNELMNYISIPASQGICPEGWHVPESNSDWAVLMNYLGTADAGGKMKEPGTTHWVPPNLGATNESGFTGLPGGYLYEGSFYSIGYFGIFWSSTQNSIFTSNALFWMLDTDDTALTNDDIGKEYGFSVRCIKN